MAGHLKKNCRKLKADKNKSVMTDSMGSSSVDNTRGSAFSAVKVNSMRLTDKWLCDSGASHHMTANQYFAIYKRFSGPINISSTDKGTILACGAGRVNIEMLVEGKWCPGYFEEVWYVPDIGRHLTSVHSAVEHGIGIAIKRKRVAPTRRSACVNRRVDDRFIHHKHARCGPRVPAEVNIAMASETLQLWHERLGRQDKRHVRKVLERMEINMSAGEKGGFCDVCV